MNSSSSRFNGRGEKPRLRPTPVRRARQAKDSLHYAKLGIATQTRHLAVEIDSPETDIRNYKLERNIDEISRCMNSSGDITRCVVQSRQCVFSLSAICPAALHCTRSLARAGRVM